MYDKQQGNYLVINPWCNEQQNEQMLQDMQNKSMQLKEGDQRASRVKARRAKYREIQDWQERSPQANTN